MFSRINIPLAWQAGGCKHLLACYKIHQPWASGLVTFWPLLCRFCVGYFWYTYQAILFLCKCLWNNKVIIILSFDINRNIQLTLFVKYLLISNFIYIYYVYVDILNIKSLPNVTASILVKITRKISIMNSTPFLYHKSYRSNCKV